MLKTIITREMMDHIKSNKLWISIITVNLIVIIVTVSHLVNYRERVLNYHRDTNKVVEELTWQVIKPPQVLSLFSQGMDTSAHNTAQVSIFSITFGEEDVSLNGSNRFGSASAYAHLDIRFIGSVLLSLFVIFLFYDVVSGEKRGGTLGVVLSNSVPRHRFLLGKLISGVLVIAVLVALPFMIVAILFLLSPVVMLTGSDLVMIAVMYMFSLLYLTFFYLLSLFVSVKVNNPTTGLAVLLMLWLLIVHVYPSAGVFLVDTLYKNPSRRALIIQKTEAQRQSSDALNTRIEQNGEQISVLHAQRYYGQERFRFDLHNKQNLLREKHIADMFTILSPSVLYKRTMEACSQTGYESTDHFLQQVVAYWDHSFAFEPHENDSKFYEYMERVSTPPGFEYRQFPVAKSLRMTVWPLFTFVAMNTILFLLAYVGFLRKDVR